MRIKRNTQSESAVIEAGRAQVPEFEPAILASWPKARVLDIRRRRAQRSRLMATAGGRARAAS